MSDETIERPSRRQREMLHDNGETEVQEPDRRATGSRVRPTSDTVTIACNLPNGLMIQGWEMVTRRIAAQGGYQDETVAAPIEALGRFQINGSGVIQGMPTSHLVGGYRLTRGCPRDLWENWSHFFADSPLIKSRSVYAHEKVSELKAFARDNRTTKSGLERIDGDKPHTLVRGIKREKQPDKDDPSLDDEEY